VHGDGALQEYRGTDLLCVWGDIVSLRRTYLSVAEAIKRAVQDNAPANESELYFAGVRSTALEIADEFEAQSHSFDRARFLQQCGLRE
jgi:hypothetical protein